jgi:ketosteroid isomerase-like protein
VRTLLAIAVLLSVAGQQPLAQPGIPPDLAAMAATEREFARAAAAKGWRDAFLEFFADDAIAFTPEVAPAKDGLRKQPPAPPSEFELLWEPRTGDVAASGDLGWLTGPSTAINHKAPGGAKPRYGCYLSIWRRQPDGRWRVIVDVGVNAPAPVQFPPGLTRTSVDTHYAGPEKGDAAVASLSAVDRELNGEVAAKGFAALASRAAPLSRLHRPGNAPVVGADAMAAWLREHETAGTATPAAAHASAAGDFGYTHGRFSVTAPAASTGVYIRLWRRDAAGRWWLMADVSQVFPPAR